MKKMKFECVEEITTALKERFEGIQSDSYGFCCGSDYDTYHTYINDDDYVCAKIYKGGLNNNFDYDSNRFELCTSVIYFMWCLTKFELSEVCEVMQNIAEKYGYTIVIPSDTLKCIELRNSEEN